MLSNAPFTQLEEAADSFIKSEYPKALTNAFLLFLSIIVFTVGISLLVYSILKQKSAYVSERLTKKAYHYLLMIIGIALSVLQFDSSAGTPLLLFSIASIAIAVAGALILFFRKRLGVSFLLISVWMTLPLKEAFKLSAVYADWFSISQYNAASKVAILAADKMIIGRIAVLALIASIITVLTIAYYTKRRYFFKSSYERWFSDVSSCPVCQSPLTGNAQFCPTCGKSIEGSEPSQLKWAPLDDPKYCEKCGKSLSANGTCQHCDFSKSLQADLDNLFAGNISDKVKSLIACILVAVIVFIPVFRGNVIGQLVEDAALYNNRYVETFKEWRDDPSLSADPSWLAEYDARSTALSDFNSRIFEVEPDNLNYLMLYEYVQYAEASYSQMAVLQRTNEAVHLLKPLDASTLGAYFDKTLSLQQQALISGLKLNIGWWQSAQNLILDSCRFYLALIPSVVLSCILLSGGTIGIVLSIVLLLKHRNKSPFIFKATADISLEEKQMREAQYAKYARTERIYTIIGSAIAVTIIALGMLLSINTTNPASTTEGTIQTVFFSEGTELILWLSDCQNDPQKAINDRERINLLLEDCTNHLTVLTQSSEIDEEMSFVLDQLQVNIDVLKADIASERLPENATIKQLTEWLIKGMDQQSQRLIEVVFDSLQELF